MGVSKELVISSNRHETRAAILEDDQLVEVYFQRSNEYSLAGSIHKGRVTRVLPGMQSAFVDLGLERDTFLYVSDFFEENEEYDRIAGPDERPQREERSAREARPPREDRSSRDDRGQRGGDRSPEKTVTAASAATDLPAEAVEDASSPRADRPEADARDRRGRRSRRRRGRGRGFPESKYASEVNSEPEAASEEAETATKAFERDVILLPGESLAKYSRGGSSHEVSDDTESSEEELPAEDRVLTVSGFPEASYFPLPELEVPEPEQAFAETGGPEGGAHLTLIDEADESPDSDGEIDEEAPEYSAAEDRAIEELEADVAAAEAEDTGDAAEELARAESLDSSEAEITAAIEDAVDSGSAEPAPRRADVRERDGRYLQRGSRRMRRRRGGDRGGHAESPAAEPAAIAGAGAALAQTQPRGAQRSEKPATTPSITDLLREGQEIIVQIAKEPLGQKGARITSHIALPGRYVVYMPTLEHLGVSRKIASDEERQRLKRILQAHRTGATGGFIVRTAGEGKSDDDIGSDMAYLYNLWLDIRQKAEKKPAPVLLHHDLEIVQRILRDQLTESFKAIWVDSEEMYESVLRFMQRFQPALVSRVKMYTRPAPIFDTFNITSELEKALRPKVWLRSGGYIVINQTEALVAIDVNTGKYVGKSNRLEDTITKTNTEAVKEIVRQIRLRDLGGIIVVDFIDMDERKNRQKVMQALEEAMRADRAPYKILQFNDFGLVAITRKRVKQSLERTLCAPCPACEGSGYIKSVQTIVGEILVEANKIRNVVEGKNVMLRTHPEVAKFLKSHRNKYLEELEEVLGRPVLVTSDATLTQDKFDLA